MEILGKTLILNQFIDSARRRRKFWSSYDKTVNFPSENPQDAVKGGVVTPHKYFSGKFLITALRHKVTNDEYTMSVEAIKDGYRSQISKGFGMAAPEIQTPDGTQTTSQGDTGFVGGT